MYQRIVFFGTLVFFSVTMVVAFQNCSTLTESAPVAVNNKISSSKITILNPEGKESFRFKTGDLAHFVFQNVIAVCVDQPGQEAACVNEKGQPLMGKFSEITEEGAEGLVEKDIEMQYPGKMLIYGYTNDPIYPVISTSIQIEETNSPKPASVQ